MAKSEYPISIGKCENFGQPAQIAKISAKQFMLLLLE